MRRMAALAVRAAVLLLASGCSDGAGPGAERGLAIAPAPESGGGLPSWRP